ncbi:MAG: DtxR family iron (metal) dependent repressor [Promethearchaeota archaeon CR_4]|nr:MAG: DtxR family iron (metal) dependent repressor [Candidatus Lokiarchaeota archaeon CR_4]
MVTNILQDHSKFKQEYLKVIYNLCKKQPRTYVSNSQIATSLNVKPPSVSEMIAKLKKDGLIEWKKRKGVRLTPEGQRIAINLIEKYTLVKYIFQKLFKIQDEGTLDYLACNIEHFITDGIVSSLWNTLLQNE